MFYVHSQYENGRQNRAPNRLSSTHSPAKAARSPSPCRVGRARLPHGIYGCASTYLSPWTRRRAPLQLLPTSLLPSVRAPGLGSLARSAARPVAALRSFPRGIHLAFGAATVVALESEAVRRPLVRSCPRSPVQPAGRSGSPRCEAGNGRGASYLGTNPRLPSPRTLPGDGRRHHAGRALEIEPSRFSAPAEGGSKGLSRMPARSSRSSLARRRLEAAARHAPLRRAPASSQERAQALECSHRKSLRARRGGMSRRS